jgi:hypothetical protein
MESILGVPDLSSANSSSAFQWSCNVGACSFSSSVPNYLRKHVRRVEHAKCELCLLDFKTKSELRKHNQSVHRIKVFKCALCDIYSTDRKWNLKIHENKHNKSGSKRYNCNKCPHSTNISSNFKKHFLTHRDSFAESGNLAKYQAERKNYPRDLKKYQCAKCSYSSNFRFNMKKHTHTHKDAKQALAHINSFWANKTEIIERHFQTVTKRPHMCSLCPSSGEKCIVKILQEKHEHKTLL